MRHHSRRWVEKWKNLFYAALFAANLIAVTGTAEAALITVSDSLTGQSPQVYAQIGNLELSKFDPLLGTLNSATITFSDHFTWTSMAENTDGPNKVFSHTLNQRVTVMDGIKTMLDDPNSYSGSWVLSAYDGMLDFGGTSGITAHGSSAPASVRLVITGDDLSRFIGMDSLLFAVLSNSGSTLSLQGGNGSMGSRQNYFASAVVEYDYMPTPIPAAAWLLGSGLLGLVGIRRRTA